MKNQITHSILMIEPVAFYYNAETAVNNFFQETPEEARHKIQEKVLYEFQIMVDKLRANGVQVITLKDTLDPPTPDSIFPNNWLTTHQDGRVAFYPMFAENRRNERRVDVLDVFEEHDFAITEIVDYTEAEEEGIFLEGTGSMILDRVNRIAYAAISPRTDEALFEEFCEDFEFSPVAFIANQTVNGKREQIYHTNVMMCVGTEYAVICLDAIDDKKQKKQVVDMLKDSGKEIISITEKQMHQFAGNMLQVKNSKGTPFLVMSRSAFDSLTDEQIQKINKYNEIIDVEIPTIEKLGGGSARCMMAEIFLPKIGENKV